MTKAQRIKNLKAQQKELIRKGCEADARGALGIALSYYREAGLVQEYIDEVRRGGEKQC